MKIIATISVCVVLASCGGGGKNQVENSVQLKDKSVSTLAILTAANQ